MNAEGKVPVCYVVDREPGIRRLVSSALESFKIDVKLFDTLTDMMGAPWTCEPDLVFIDVTVGGSEGVEMIDRLAETGAKYPIQILSGLNPVLIEQIRRQGERTGLRMLPVLPKPLQSGTIRQVVTALGMRRDAHASIKVDLQEVFAEGWIELWYQPTIDLKLREMVGAEAFVRARHPQHGILMPETLLSNASEQELLDLTGRILGRALRDWPAFATIGMPVELSINVPIAVLSKLSIFGIMWEQKPDAPNWPGLTLEIAEEEAVHNIPLVNKALKELQPYGISISVDNFGPSYAELSRLTELPFKELKIDRSYISNCDTDRMNKGLCETIVEFAHKFGLTAVAEGIETAGELNVLRDMGCDIGQGYLFARPQPKEELLAMIRRRSRTRNAA
jgi:EAL domain-containing protein (putative c-di-GMP-specific phosphodiesterase class I)/FixJ family two-component response regulator